MPQLVEDAGGELSAGYVFKRRRWVGTSRGSATLGGRAVGWEVVPGGVAVTHPPASPATDPVGYVVPTVATPMPSGGNRHWWACPGCGRRADALYLPAGRDRLGCRTCCRLTYQSQQTAKPVTVRKERPGLWTERHYRRWEFDPTARRLVLVADRFTRRRL